MKRRHCLDWLVPDTAYWFRLQPTQKKNRGRTLNLTQIQFMDCTAKSRSRHKKWHHGAERRNHDSVLVWSKQTDVRQWIAAYFASMWCSFCPVRIISPLCLEVFDLLAIECAARSGLEFSAFARDIMTSQNVRKWRRNKQRWLQSDMGDIRSRLKREKRCASSRQTRDLEGLFTCS